MNRFRRAFISTSSADRDLRNGVVKSLRKAGYAPIVQDEMPNIGHTLVKLSDFIEWESDLIIQILTCNSGSVPSEDIDSLIQHLGAAEIERRIPRILEGNLARKLTYTQWEAWLALFFDKQVLTFVRSSDYSQAETTNCFEQINEKTVSLREHIESLKNESKAGHPTIFSDGTDLQIAVHECLSRLDSRQSKQKTSRREFFIIVAGCFVLTTAAIYLAYQLQAARRIAGTAIDSNAPSQEKEAKISIGILKPFELPDPTGLFPAMPSSDEVGSSVRKHDFVLKYCNRMNQHGTLLLMDIQSFYESRTVWREIPAPANMTAYEEYRRFPTGVGWSGIAFRSDAGDITDLGCFDLSSLESNKLCVVSESGKPVISWGIK